MPALERRVPPAVMPRRAALSPFEEPTQESNRVATQCSVEASPQSAAPPGAPLARSIRLRAVLARAAPRQWQTPLRRAQHRVGEQPLPAVRAPLWRFQRLRASAPFLGLSRRLAPSLGGISAPRKG